MSPAEPRAALESFMARYLPEIRARANGALASLRKQIPGALELVYDNYNALVVAFGASQKMADIVCSIALYPRWVTLFFMRGTSLADPARLLKGSGKAIRHVVLADDAAIDSAPVRALIAQARASSPAAVLQGKGAMVIKSVSPKQRPRRPVEASGRAADGTRKKAAVKKAAVKKPAAKKAAAKKRRS